MKRLFALLVVASVFFTSVHANQTSTDPRPTSLLAKQITANTTDPVRKTRLMVDWLQQNLQWTYTDYQKRTVDEIITRRAGNCAELASVLRAMLNEAGVKSRWLTEINIHPVTPTRQATAERKVKESGNHMSVFGLRHNDHRWLEVYDEAAQAWVPADPAAGLVGTPDWVRARLAFSDRLQSPIPDVAKVMSQMIAPVVVLSLSQGKVAEERSRHYLLEEFNRLYGGKLSGLPSWPRWTKSVERLIDVAGAAFEGRVNLHLEQAVIDEAAETYEALRREAAAAGIQAVPMTKN